MLELFQSPSAAARLSAAHAFIERFPRATEILLVGTARDAADEVARRITLERGATFGLHRTSFVQLIVRLAAAEMARLGVAPATSLGVDAVAARVSFEALQEGALTYFEPVARFSGFARALARTLGEVRLGHVAVGALMTLGGSARDVEELAGRFERQLELGMVADRVALITMATRAVSQGRDESLRQMPMLLLDVPIDRTAERAFVEALVAVSPVVLATVPTGDDATLQALHGMGGRRSAGEADPGGDQRERGDDSDLGRGRDFIFAAAAPPPREVRGDVVFFSAPGEGRETVEIARRILDEAQAGTPFDEMAVLLRAPEMYASQLEVALRRAGIPAWFARGTSRPDPSGRAFLALLDCALEGLSARRFAEYLSLGQVPPLDEAGAPPVDRAVWAAPENETLGAAAEIAPAASLEAAPSDTSGSPEGDTDDRPVVEGTLRAPWRWEQLLVESAVIGGKDRWSRRLAGLEAEFRARLARLREEEPDSPRASAIERDLANLEHLRRFAVPVIERLTVLPARGTWGEWIAALETLAPIVLRRPERVLTVLAELRPLDVIGPVALGEVRDVLAGELTTLAERPPADRYGRVFVGTIEQARGRSFEVVFLPGLAERVFPQKPREDPILLDALRRVLGAPLGSDRAPLATQDDRAHRERLLLRLAVGAARRRLHLSYSRIEQTEARPRVPSFYALEVARALTGRVPGPQRMERDAAAAAGARLAWPAPDDPVRAIDEVEHDLATLRALLAGGETRGRARYLLELNDALARSLRTRWARWRRGFSAADGITRVTDGTRETLAASRLAARAYSASALQKFAACPYQFFLSAICRLEPRPEVAPIVKLDPATRGHLFHRVQADVMRVLANEGRLPLAADGIEYARAALDRTLDRVAEAYREQLAPAIQRVWQDEVESMRADLRMWLEQSAATHAEWEPIAFELAFGLRRDPANDPRSVEAEVALSEGYRLRGIVDLVERRRGAPDLRVTDYKTGRDYMRRNRLIVGGGEMLQPVIYGLAVEHLLAARVVESRLYYCTRAGGFSERVVPLTSETRGRGPEVLSVIDRAITAGFLPAAPRKGACGICDFRDVCGPSEEIRIALKDQARIEELRALRECP